ncbi:arylesterase [Kordiimonas aquimaris]|uniref:arylesterase n=1 Tax=Kordiimonas aquimaris TaxID=707591 RepID=UPI0021D23EEE|nr:arylesterase [Kordiimonas aquimaris]
MKVNRLTKILLLTRSFCVLALFAISGSIYAVQSDNEDKTVQVLAFGDSLTAGYGLPAGDGFTDQLEVWLNQNIDESVKVINAGVSGDTSSGGRSRLDWALAPVKGGKPDLVILELGANDALRGVAPEITRDNMDAMVKTLMDRGIPVLIAGMLASPSWGPDYQATFDAIFPDLKEKYDVPLYPFFLDGVATIASLNQEDGIHPTKEGVAIIIDKMGPYVVRALSK